MRSLEISLFLGPALYEGHAKSPLSHCLTFPNPLWSQVPILKILVHLEVCIKLVCLLV